MMVGAVRILGKPGDMGFMRPILGRFPHRNEILGRGSTPEELAYLDSKEAFTGG